MTSVDREAQQQVLAELLGGAPPLPAEPVAPPVGQPFRRDQKGRFLRGNPGGPGRRPGQGLDYRALAEREAEREGIDLPQAMWRVLRKLIELAQAGDVAAAKLVLDKLGIVEDAQQAAGVQLVVITGVDDTGTPVRGVGLRVNQPTVEELVE